jgi:NTP pyrophosphatase (non-canonical NTP hydrolase)
MKIQERAYKSAVNRGKITEFTTDEDFLLHLQKEVAELFQANEVGDINYVIDRTDQLISSSTKPIENVSDVQRETAKHFYKLYKNNMSGTKADELADIALICATYAQKLGIDLFKMMELKTIYNELRPDNKIKP